MDATQATTVGALTKQDITALRTADRVSFHHNAGKGSVIRGTKEVKNAGPWEERERTYEIACEGSVRVYKDGDVTARNAQCFAMNHSGQFSDTWQTVVSAMRPGDVVLLEWVGSDNNGYLNGVQGQPLYHDRLYLLIRREGKRPLKFHVEDSICPNNTARMIRPV